MKREEAVETLNLIKSIVERTRDESILQNWGEVFILAGGFKLAFSIISNHWARGEPATGDVPFIALWLGYLALLALLILFIRRKRPGVRSFVERQIWGIWVTYILACYLTSAINRLLGLSRFELLPVMALLAAVGWSAMAVGISFRFLVPSVLFAAAALVMCLLREFQWTILGGVWFATLEVAGISFLLRKARMARLSDARFL